MSIRGRGSAALRAAVVAVLLWQAGLGAYTIATRASQSLQVGFNQKMADSDARIRATLGAGYGIYTMLRDTVPGTEMVLLRLPPPETASLADWQDAQMTIHLRHLLFPRPFLHRVTPDPVGVAETSCPEGQSAWFFARKSDPKPEGRPSWSCNHRIDGYELWRFKKE